MLLYGFPLQYTGPPVAKRLTKNHSSATNFPSHVSEYIQKEITELAIVGPFDQHPFPDWSYTNPIMSRPKTNSDKRHIIVDLSYPEGSGINSYVAKNHVFGKYIQHSLPVIQQAIDIAKELEYDVLVGIVDIERAYRNFRTDPLDWPLSVISFQEKYFLDVAMPFGARLSSLYMQKLAEFIVRALTKKGVYCLQYLDDLICIVKRDASAQPLFAEAMATI